MTHSHPWHILLLLSALPTTLFAQTAAAQEYVYTPGYADAPPVTPLQPAQSTYAGDQLDEMLGPIALYPDPLLSEVLAAATYPQDIAAAGQLLAYNTLSDDAIDTQNWDPSVKAVAHYPDVIRMMASQMDWTEALGGAFAAQPQDVMDAVQRLRAKAQTARTLATTPQQEVVNDNGMIEILPAQPNVIYVPQYDAGVVYSSPPYDGPWITFGQAWPVGLWFDLGWDWHRRFINRGVNWGHDWHHPDFDHGQRWEHDRRRPIPVPVHPFVPPRGQAGSRGWNDGHRPGAFNPGTPSRTVTPRPPNRAERPVTGIPRPTPRPVPNPTGRGTPPNRGTPAGRGAPSARGTATPAPARGTPVQPARPAVPAPPRAIPNVPQPPKVVPHVTPAPHRPVTGLPPRPTPAARPAPTPAPRPAPAPARPAPAQHVSPPPAPSPAFHPGGGAQGASNRGHQSLGGRGK